MTATPVRQIMTSPVVTIRADASLTDAARTMQDAAIGSVIVVDDENRPEGILTRTDFVQLAADEQSATDTDVRAVMETDVVSVPADEPLETAVATMTDHGIHHLPIVNETDEIVGVVTTTDLAETSYDGPA